MLRHKPAARLQRSSLIPTIIWGLLVLAVLAVASPWGQRWFGAPLTIFSMSDTTEADRTTSSTFIPVVYAREVLDAPETAARTLRERYELNASFYGKQWENAQIRFVSKPPPKFIHDTMTHGLGGPWVKVDAYTAFSDISGITPNMGMDAYPPESVETDYYGAPTEPESKLALTTRTIRMNGGQDIQRRVLPRSIASSILAIWLTLLVITAITARFGMRVFRSWKLKLSLLGVVLILVPLIGSNLRHENQSFIPQRTKTGPPQAVGGWISSDAFTSLMLDEDQDQERAESISQLAQAADPDHVLGLEIMKDHASAYAMHTAQLSEHFPLGLVHQMGHFNERADGSRENLELPKDQQGAFKVRLSPLAETIMIMMSSRHTIWAVSLNWANIILLLGVLWLIHRLLLFVGVRFAYRTQHKRFKRGQCIFCAYPLSPQALAARSGDSGS